MEEKNLRKKKSSFDELYNLQFQRKLIKKKLKYDTWRFVIGLFW